jgi:hypothetical protein
VEGLDCSAESSSPTVKYLTSELRVVHPTNFLDALAFSNNAVNATKDSMLNVLHQRSRGLPFALSLILPTPQ